MTTEATVTEESVQVQAIDALATDLAEEATIVDEGTAVEQAAEEAAEQEAKARADLLKKVTKIVERPEEPKTKQPGGDEVPAADEAAAAKKPDEFDQALKDRATEAGIPEALQVKLHESGVLEETLAALDRKLIEAARPKDSKQDGEPKPKPAKAEAKPESDGGEIPELDPEEFDERLLARDAYLEQRIAQLEAMIAGRRSQRVDQWLDGAVAGLKNDKLFKDPKNREALRDGYEAICEAAGLDPGDCHEEVLRRAYPAMFPKEVFKAAQRETVQRLRDAEGRFIQPTKASGRPPGQKFLSDEERREALLKKVNGILAR